METLYTEESIEALPRKADVLEIAAAMGLDTEGTRLELTDRILEAQQRLTDREPSVSDAGVTSDAEVTEVINGEASSTGETTETATPIELSYAARLALSQLVASYLGTEKAYREMQNVYKAVSNMQQPCIMIGDENVKFYVKIFSNPFVVGDCSRDITPGLDGVAMNLARELDTKNLFPRG